MSKLFKYPRTYHLPWSEGATNDDKILQDIDCFEDMNIVVSEKVDGEGTTMYPDYIHARSVDGRDHPSRSYVKGIHGAIKANIPDGFRICGENVFAKHSIFYDKLTAYFYVFSIWNEHKCLSWKETEEFAEMLGLKTVPVLYAGKWNENAIKACWTGVSKFGSEQEGYVVRNVESFNYENFEHNCAKFVRKNHIQTNDHWMTQAIQPNKLMEK